MKKIRLKKPLQFEWNAGNIEKNILKHGVINSETGEIFFNDPVLLTDINHSQGEERYFALGKTDKGRHLIVSFTLRGENLERIRPIMSRDQNIKEKGYEQELRKEVSKRKNDK
jgi:uncharacterized DUF497 family protein